MVRLVIFVYFWQWLHGATMCEFPDLSDPDEMMDAIGRTSYCQETDTGSKNVPPPTRGDFGGGLAVSNAGNNSEGARAVAIGPGGIIYVAGRTNGGNNDFLIMRYFADGSSDTSFDTDGALTQSLGTSDDVAHAIVVLTNGSVVVAGRSDQDGAGGHRMAILRLLSAGSIDTTFNTTGKKTLDPSGGASFARSLYLQSDGKVLIGGYAKSGSAYGSAFARVTTNGRADISFGSSGTIFIVNGSSDNGILAVSADSNGFVLGGGNSYNGSNWDFGAIRLLANGTIDTTFYTSGKTTFSINTGNESAYAVQSDKLNRLILVGATNSGTNLDFGIARLQTDGTLDTTFNTNGKKTQVILSADDAAYGMWFESNGDKILAAGYAYNGSNNDYAAARFSSNGDLDTSFNSTGKYTLAVGSSEDTVQAVVTQDSVYSILAGRTDTSGSATYDIGIIRLDSAGSLAQSGTPANVYTSSGSSFAINGGGTEILYHIKQGSDHKILGVGMDNSVNFAVVRINLNGSLDTSFYTGGIYAKDFGGNDVGTSLDIQSDGKILAGGQGGAGPYLSLLKLQTDGSLDTSFYTSGSLTDTYGSTANAIFLDSGGSFVAAGTLFSTADHLLIRFLSDGTYDTTFKTNGKVTLDINGASDGLIWGFKSTNGQYIIGGGKAAVRATQIVKYFSDGALDSSFATDGSLNTNLGTTSQDTWQGTGSQWSRNMVTDDASGRILVAYYEMASRTGPWKTGVARLTDAGILDTSFSTNGKDDYSTGIASGNPGGVILSPNSKIITSHYPSSNGGGYFFRWHTSGSLDSTFKTLGYSLTTLTAWSFMKSASIMDNGLICGLVSGSDYGLACLWQ